MKRSFLLSLTAITASFGLFAARADIAASRYVGHGITPVEAPGIRMVSAKVDIHWGDPGNLVAVFVMNNEAGKAEDVQLGFPVPLPERLRKKHDFNFTMAFDGVPTDRASIRQDAPAKDANDYHAEGIWFHCHHVFPPGATTVRVQTKLPVTPAYHFPYRENLNYCIQTGAGWKGRIGSEEVTVHFPTPVLPGQIIEARPASYVVEGNTVRWHFVNFEPERRRYHESQHLVTESRPGDHDIELCALGPDVLPILADLSAKLADDPHNPRRMLDLAKHLLALADPRRTFPMTPQKLAGREYREILAMLKPADRARFRSLHTWRLDGLYHEKNGDEENSTSPQRDLDALTDMLNAAGYVPAQGRSIYHSEGRELMARLLREHPHYADAWNVYLAYLFDYDPQEVVYPFQLEQAMLARQNCPNDSAIRSWDVLARWTRRRDSLPASNGITPEDNRMFERASRLNGELKRRGIYAIRYHQYTADF